VSEQDCRPVRQGRAPLRPGADGGKSPSLLASSRPPRTGSIAASLLRAKLLPSSRSSRPPRTGSIAACSASSIWTRRRPSSRPPRTGSIAARTWKPPSAPTPTVVPSAKDGLHCGEQLAPGNVESAGSSRPPRTGSIAARVIVTVPGSVMIVVPSAKDGLHCGPSRTLNLSQPRSSRPVRQGRAPLRHPHRRLRGSCPGRSSRPPRTGSIAASEPTPRWSRSTPVVPSAKDGLHCGTEAKPRGGMTATPSSRPPRTGSIAAVTCVYCPDMGAPSRPVRQGRAPLRHLVLVLHEHRGGGRPVRQGRAPLRLRLPRGAGSVRVVVPSAKDGLHCGRPASSARGAVTGR